MRRDFHNPLDVAIPQRRGRHELRRNAFCTAYIHPIQHQHVEVRIQVQHAAEALHKGHRATTGIRVSLRPSLLAPERRAILPRNGTARARFSGKRAVPTYNLSTRLPSFTASNRFRCASRS